MSLFSPKPGFTLAELLIALALLGVIAAFTIPKVLQANAEQERVAKLRETVATLENAWYSAKATNSVFVSSPWNSFYDTVEPRLNVVRSSTATTGAAGQVFQGLGHPCDPTMGYVVFPNGVVVSGLVEITYTAGQLLAPSQADNTIFCVDTNGVNGPNLEGQDVFWGNFNPWGDFDVATGAVYTASANGRNFHWGNATESFYNAVGVEMVAFPAEVRVGYWLTR